MLHPFADVAQADAATLLGLTWAETCAIVADAQVDPPRVAALSVADIRAAMQRKLQPDRMVTVVVGGAGAAGGDGDTPAPAGAATAPAAPAAPATPATPATPAGAQP